MVKANEFRQLKKEELIKKLKEARDILASLKMELVQGKVKNTALIRNTRKDIARILTILKEKELENKE
jgi:large subunit ribosomal protein L29